MHTMQSVTIIPYQKCKPNIDSSVFLASGVRIIGDVTLAANSSVWFNTTIRGDVNFVQIGEMTNIQDNAVIHVASRGSPAIIGQKVTVGHQAMIHACTIEDLCLIGMGAIILDNATIGSQSLVAAGSIVPPGKNYPPMSLIMGAPAKVMRKLSSDEIADLEASATHYWELAKNYIKTLDTK